MGSCYYYMKATWTNPLTVEQTTSVRNFFLQAEEMDREPFEEAIKKFPTLDTPAIKTVWDSIRVSGGENVIDRLLVEPGDTTLRYSNEVSHMADWQPLCDLMVQEFGAAQASWLSEESEGVDPGSVLDYEDDAAIVQAILAQPEKDLPTFLGIHPILNAKIAKILSTQKGQPPSPYCPKCGQHFYAHNDDGSCVNDAPESERTEDSHEWEITCPKCGTFTQVQKGDPTICPKCGETDIDTIQKE